MSLAKELDTPQDITEDVIFPPGDLYAALGGKKFIGNPKQPTIFVCELVDEEYQMNPFTGNNLIVSPTLPQLNLTAQQIFDSAL